MVWKFAVSDLRVKIKSREGLFLILLSIYFIWINVFDFIYYLKAFNLSKTSIEITILLRYITIGCGFLFSGYLADYKHKKFSLIYLSLIFLIISVSLVHFLSDYKYAVFPLLFLSSFSFGVGSLAVALFFSDVTSPHERGKIVGLLLLIIFLASASIRMILFGLLDLGQTSLYTLYVSMLVLGLISIFTIPWKIKTLEFESSGNDFAHLLSLSLILLSNLFWKFGTQNIVYADLNSKLLEYIDSIDLLSFSWLVIGLSAFLFGRLSDTIGRSKILDIVCILFGTEYIIFQFSESMFAKFLVFLLDKFAWGALISVGLWIIWADFSASRNIGLNYAKAWVIFWLVFGIAFSTHITLASGEHIFGYDFGLSPSQLSSICLLFCFVALLPLQNAKEPLQDKIPRKIFQISLEKRTVSKAADDLEKSGSYLKIKDQIKKIKEKDIDLPKDMFRKGKSEVDMNEIKGYIKRSNKIHPKDLVEEFNLKTSSAQYILKKLRKQNKVEKTGKKGEYKYIDD